MRKRLPVEHDVHPPSSIFTKPQISKGFSCESSTLENCLISVVTCYDPLHTVWKEIIGNDAKLKRFRWIMYSKLSPSIFNEKNHANVTFFYAVDVDDMSEAFFFCRWKLFWGIRIRHVMAENHQILREKWVTFCQSDRCYLTNKAIAD